MIYIQSVANSHRKAPQHIDMFWQEPSYGGTILPPSTESCGLCARERCIDSYLQLDIDLGNSAGSEHTVSCTCSNTFFYNQLLNPKVHSLREKYDFAKPAGLRALFSTHNESSAHLHTSDVRGTVSVACNEKLESSSCYKPNDRHPGPGLLAFSRLRNAVHFLLNNNVNPLNGGIA